ncbi:MAG: CRTAC1 family protein, partial [Nitrospirae bacterium]|nr:CRTAC1 family protein [Nitrospirota bacterium]
DVFVDIFVANYETPFQLTIEGGIGNPHRLYRNKGDGTFAEVSQQAGVASREKMIGRGVSWGDYDNNGTLDLFVSNYRLDPDWLWRNNGNGGFTEVGRENGAAGSEVEGLFGHTIGSVWGDYDNDGDLDLFAANLAHPRYLGVSNKSMLLENLGPPDYRFVDRVRTSGIRYEETHAEPSWVDYDNDGSLDLFITSTYPNRNSFLYRGNGNGFFEDVTYLAGVRVGDGWGNAFADMDNDGDLDLVAVAGGKALLFRNEGNSHSWLQVKVVGRESNRAGIGSRVKVITGTVRQIREVEGGKGSGNQHALTVAFGFGAYRGTADIEVRFPSGKVVQKRGVALNQKMTVVEE